jgi:hypothetical protein
MDNWDDLRQESWKDHRISSIANVITFLRMKSLNERFLEWHLAEWTKIAIVRISFFAEQSE